MSERSEALDQLATALSAAQAEFGAIPKDSTNPFFKNSYASLASVVATATPVLTKHGLSISQFIGVDGDQDTLTTWLLHKSGQFICQSMRLHLTKQDAQGQGSATSYGRRYAFMSVLGLVADSDDDGQRASRPVQARQAAPRPASALVQAPALHESAVAMLRRLYAETGWSADELRMQLTAVGVEDSSDVKVAMRGLSERQADALLVAMNSAIDQAA